MASNAYRELRERVDRALVGVPDRGRYEHVLERRMRVFVLLQAGELLVLLHAPWGWLKVLAAATFALYRARAIWTVVHERVHRPELPRTPAKLAFDFFTVFVAHWWRMHHLRHHAHTNTPKDPDTRMFLGRDLGDVHQPRSLPTRAARFVLTVAQFPTLFALFLFRSLSAEPWGRAAWFLAFIVAYGAVTWLLLPPSEAALHNAANIVVGTTYILVTFAPTHSADRSNFELAGDPLADVFASTNNVWPRSTWWSHFCGGINLHVEHHLFPRVPYDQLPLVAPVVEQFARERGLPYHAWSPLGVWRAYLRLLWTT